MPEDIDVRQLNLDTYLPFAYVRRWTAITTEALCPYQCQQRRHSFDDCPSQVDENATLVRSCSKDKHRRFRLLYPFQREALRQGLGFVLDLEGMQWTSVSTKGDWPFEITEPFLSAQQESRSPVEGASLTLTPIVGKEVFRRAFVCARMDGHKMTAMAMLMLLESPKDFIDSSTAGETLIATACKIGNLQAVQILLEQGADPDISGAANDPPLTTAVRLFHTDIAWRLIHHGASIFCIDTGGKSLYAIANDAASRLGARSVVPGLTETLEISSASHFVDVAEGLAAISSLLEMRMFQEARAQLTSNEAGDGSNEATIRKHFVLREAHDSEASVGVYREIFRAPMKSRNTSYAALDRGPPFPMLHALSGSSKGRFNHTDGTLDREVWTQRVIVLAGIIKHQFPLRESRAYWACHAEKQVIAAFLWYHSAVFLSTLSPRPSRKETRQRQALIDSAPTRPWTPRRGLVVSQSLCRDCEAFLDCILRHLGLSFQVVVAQERLP